MKTLMTIILFALLQVSALAQSVPSFESGSFEPELSKELGKAEASDAATAPDEDESEWKPKFRVVLQLTEDGQVASGNRIVKVAEISYVAKQQTIKDPFGNSTVVSVRTPQRRFRDVTVPNIMFPAASIGCDDMSVAASGDGKNAEYVFEAKGKCILFLTGMQIHADSMKLENSELSVVNAKVINGQTELRSAQMTIPLRVFGISTHIFNKSSTELAYEPLLPTTQILSPTTDSDRPISRGFDNDTPIRTPVHPPFSDSDSSDAKGKVFPKIEERFRRRSSISATE